MKRLKVSDFSDVFNDKLTDYVKIKIKDYDFSYQELSFKERDIWMRKILGVLFAFNIEEAGEKRLGKWENGWGENFAKFEASPTIDSISPGYFSKYNIVRWKQKFIKPINKNFEQNSLAIIQDWLFDKYMRKTKTVYEFGCGTGHNLFRVRDVNPNAEIWGLDWASSSQKIIQKLVSDGLARDFFAHSFDFFNPDYSFKLKEDSIVFTSAALEQVGNRYKIFLDYLIKQKPALCIHIEPIEELLDENNLLDYLSIQYFHKRKYLTGYMNYLKNLETQGEINIIKANRTYIGSLFIEGYSVIVWRPVSK